VALKRSFARTALLDYRWLTILALSVILSVVLLKTPLAGRVWMILAWGVGVYVLAVAASALAHARQVHGRSPTSPIAVSVPAEVPRVEVPVRLTEEALRRLNNPAALADCTLAGYLPLTLGVLAASDGDGLTAPHQALRAAVVQAIERLRLDHGGSEQNLYRAILADEYVMGHSTARIMTRYAISESTFHRHRREAIRAVAQDLIARERALAVSGRK